MDLYEYIVTVLWILLLM